MLFVYVGTVIVEFNKEVADEFCIPMFKWESLISREQSLRQAVTHEYSSICKDVSKLHVAFCSAKSPGKFTRVQESGDTAIYFYQHASHVAYSSVTCTKLVNLLEKGGIAEQVKLLDPCVDIKCHASYYPCFYGDKQCELMLTCLVKTGRISPEEYQSLQGQLEKIKHELANKLRVVPSDGYVNALAYQEDDWTERLYHCLQYNKIDTQLTAHLRGSAVSQSWAARIPPGVSFDSLIFHGAPDLIIAAKREGIVTTGLDDDDDDNEKMAEGTEEEDLPSSQGSGRIQVAHQMPSCVPYETDSFLYDKVGKLVAAVLNSLTCRVFRKYKRGEKVVSLTGHGLHVHRAIGVFHVKVTLSHKTLKVTSVQLIDGLLSPELWCATIHQFIKIISNDGEELD